MMLAPEKLVADFAAAVPGHVVGWPCIIRTEVLLAPHSQPGLPVGYGAVYVFALGQRAGGRSVAGAGTVLKVGKAGPNSDARFRSQHYLPSSAGSVLAKSLLGHPFLWPWLGIESVDQTSVKAWMLSSLDRYHFLVPGDRPAVLHALEVYIRARVGSVFEGAA